MILKLLLMQAGGQAPADALCGELGDKDWRSLLQAGMLAQYLAASGRDRKDMPYQYRLYLEVARRISDLQMALLREIHCELSQCGIAVGLLKGGALANTHYVSPDCRPMADLDLLVAPGDAALARQRLHGIGFVNHEDSHTRKDECDHHQEPLFHPVRGLWVEIHTSLFPTASPCANLPVFQQPVESTHIANVGGDDFRVLNTQLQFLYLTSHWAQAMQGRGKFHGLLDIVLLKQDQQLDLGRILAGLEAPALCKTVGVALEVLRRCGAMHKEYEAGLRRVQKRARVGFLRRWLFCEMTEQLVLDKPGIFHLLGSDLVTQWWLELMHAKTDLIGVLRMIYRLFVPMDYGGPRGWALQKHRLRAFGRRLFRSNLALL